MARIMPSARMRDRIMPRYMQTILLSLALVWSSMACAPKLGGPTVPSSYVFSLDTSDPRIYLQPLGSLLAARLPRVAELVVRVQDAQGRPVDGVAVRFALEPPWPQSASITPQQAHTRDGRVRAILEPETTGLIRVRARVENVTQEVAIVVSRRGEGGSSSE